MARFYDPAFAAVADELERVFETAWDGYQQYRKSPRTQPAGRGYADPEHPLPLEWVTAKRSIDHAMNAQRDQSRPSRILLVSASTRSEHTCPGEVSKTRRLAEHAKQTIEALPITRSICSTCRRWPMSR